MCGPSLRESAVGLNDGGKRRLADESTAVIAFDGRGDSRRTVGGHRTRRPCESEVKRVEKLVVAEVRRPPAELGVASPGFEPALRRDRIARRVDCPKGLVD